MPHSDCETQSNGSGECLAPEIVKMTINEMGQRLCHIVKRVDFDGYGFNLHSEKGKPGQFIGKVDDHSPAEDAGLKQGDRIIEVNGVNIGTESHKQVVQRIKAITNEVRLLVIDPELEKKKPKTTTSSSASTATVRTVSVEEETPAPPLPDMKVMKVNHNNNMQQQSPEGVVVGEEVAIRTNPTKAPTPTSAAANAFTTVVDGELFIETKSNGRHSSNGHSTTLRTTLTPTENGNGGNPMNHPSPSPTPNPPAPAVAAPVVTPLPPQMPLPPPPSAVTAATEPSKPSTGLNLTMTAAELRAKLLAKKKYDPKNDTVDLKKKFDIIQKL